MLSRLFSAVAVLVIFSTGTLLAQNSDIVPKSGYTYPTNINYANFQEATDIVVSGTSVEVASFTLRDGGAGAPDGDSNPTNLTSITFSLSNSSNIRRVALYDAAGTAELGTEQVSGASVTFSGLSISAADNGTVDFRLRVSFNSTVTDNAQFAFTVTSVSGSGSSFVNGSAGGAASSTTGDDNRIEVGSTKLRFVQGPSNVFINQNMAPAVTVEVTDANNNRDLDNTANIDITSTGTLSGTTVTQAAVAGLATYSSLVHTAAGAGRTLSAASSGLTSTGASSAFFVSGGSDIIADGTFTYPTNIDYASAANQNTSIGGSTGTSIARFTVRDGGGVTDPGTNTTVLTDITFDLGPNWAMIREVELRDGADGAALTGAGETAPSSQNLSFAGMTLAAPDNGSINFLVKITWKGLGAVTDNSQFPVTITAATATGSPFADADAGGATTDTSGDNNRIEVTASKLLFVQQPTNTPVVVNMSPAVTVRATDALDNTDLDYTGNITLTSTGTPAGQGTVAAVAGVATFSAVSHTAVATGRTVAADDSGPLTATGNSNTFNITGTSDIIANAGFTYPTNIAYHNFQATDVTSGNSVLAMQFDLRDGAGAADADAAGTTLTNLTLDLGTNFANIRQVALFDAAGTTQLTGSSEVTVAAQTVAFSGLTLAAADDGSTTFSVRVSFNDPATDNQQFSFTVTAATAQSGGSQFAAANAGGATSSVAGDNNRIEVTATKLLFVQQPSNAFINVAMTPAVTIQAVDALDNRDLDFVANIDVTSTGTLTGSPVSVAAVAGVATFSTLSHSVAGTGLTISGASGGLTATGASTTFNISGGSDIIADPTFVYPTNIPYASHQEASDITNGSSSIIVARFTIRDGGGAADPDALGTIMTDLQLDLGPNFNLIRRIELRQANDGGPASSAIEQNVSTQLISFTGLSGAEVTAPDGGSINVLVRVSFKSVVTDNLQISFTVNSATASGAGSAFASANAGGATTSTAGDDNRIEVTRTKLLWVTQPTSVFANVAMTPAPEVRATDANDNTDLDFTASVSMTSNGTPTNQGSVNAVAGVATFPSIIHTAVASNKNLTAASTGLTSTPLSNQFNIVAPGSDIITDGSFTYPTNIAYENFQEAADITNSGTSLVVGQFTIRDGSGTNDGGTNPTTMTDLTLDLGPNFANIRRVALFDAAGTSQLAGTSEQAVAAQTVAFSGLSIAAPDNGNINFTVRVSFNDPVTDNQQVTITISAATATGSTFSSANAGGATTSTAGDDNRIEVTATKLLFVQAPTNTFINTAMAPAVTIQSVDALDNRDLDNTSTVSVTSTGTLTGSPVSVAAINGLATFSTLTHTATGTGLTLSATAATPSLTGVGPSTTFNILGPNNTSDIAVNGAFVYPTNIPYHSHQEAANITNSGTSLVVARFDLRDGGGVSDADPFPTTLTGLSLDLGANFGLIRRIALYDAAGTTELTGTNDQAVSTQVVNFSGLTLSAADNGTTSFSVRVSFADPVTDNQQFSITVSSATAQANNSQFATGNAGGATTSTAGDNNRIEVTATKLLFVQQPTGTFINLAMSPAVTLEAVDALDNRDLDNASTVTITSTGTLVGSPVSNGAVAGLATFATLTHSFAGAGLTLSATAAGPALTGIVSNTFAISDGSDIVADGGFTYPTNIAYNTFQEVTDITNSTTSLVTARFLLRDGGVAPVDPDLFPTVLTNLTLDLGPNFGLIRRIALYDATGTTELPALGTNEQVVLGQLVSFNGLSLAAADDNSIAFTIRVSYRSSVTDNLQYSFTVVNAASQPGNSFFAAPDAGGAVTSTSGNNNRIEVTASELHFVQQPSNVYINLSMSPAVTIQATDNLLNRDLDYTGTVSVTSTGTLTGSPVNAAAVSGLATYATLAHSVAQLGRTLSATAGGLTGTGASLSFDVLPPNAASDIVLDGTFVHPSNVAYNNFQEAANITNSGTSTVLTRFTLRDGGGAADADPFGTQLNSITLSIANSAFLRRIALYDATGTTELTGTNEQVVGSSVTFSGLNLTAPDNGSISFTVRASFNDPVTDNQQVSFTVTAASALATNSGFAAANAGGAASSTALDDNRIEVTATKLLFVQQPTTQYINVFIAPAVTVEAVDPLDNRDLDNTSNITITSTGVLTGSPVTSVAASGLATFSTLAHSVAAAGRTLSATSVAPVLTGTGPSTAFNILAPSNASDIVLNGAFVHPVNIPYDTYQEAFNITNSTTSVVVAEFTIRDGGGAADPDPFGTQLNNLTLDLGTNFGLIRRIALYDATGTTELTGTNEQLVSTQLVSFSGLTIAAPDNGSTTFSVRVSFRDPVTDNQQFSVAVNAASALAVNSAFAAANAGGAITSTAGNNNRIEVTATKLLFVQQPTDAYINVAIAPSVTVEAVDNLDNRDLDNTSNVSITSSGVLSGSPVTNAAVAGLATFPTLTHTVAQAGVVFTASAAGPALGGVFSNAFNILGPTGNSNIVLNGGFTHPTNVAYSTFQEPANITNSGTSLVVTKFDVQDGAGAADGDPFPTVLTNLTLDLGPNFSFIRRIALYDAAGTAELTGTNEQAVASQFVSFSGLNISAADGGTTTFSVRVSFNSTVTDNQQFSFAINSVTALNINSQFALANGGGAISSTSGDNNRIEVTATKLDYVSIAATAFINASFPVTVHARDANNNLDLDFGGTVSSITNAGGLLTNPSPATSGVFTAGVKTFAFEYLTEGNGTLTMSTTTPTISNQISPAITVTASSETRVYLTGPYSPRIDYINHQQASNPSTFILARLTLTDGDADGTPGDADLAPSVLDQLQVSLTNSSFIRRIAVYNDAGTLIAGTDQNGAASVTFSSLNITAPDDGSKTFTIRASFDFNNVVDEQNVQLVITSATAGVGSKFLTGAGLVGGSTLANRTSPATGANMMDVVATQTVFIQSPPANVGTKQPVPISPATQVEVRAHDANGKLDTEFHTSNSSKVVFTLNGTNPSNLIFPSHRFNLGIALIPRDSLQYDREGDGTLTANVSNPPPTAVAVTPGVSSHVDVFEVRAIYSFGGVTTQVNLASGSVDKVIYGVTFETNYSTPSNNGPELKKFKVSFDHLGADIRNVIKSNTVRVFEQIDNANYVGGTNITSFGGVVTVTATQIEVDLSASPRDFYSSPGVSHRYTYFFMVDIVGTANSSTPSLTPYVEDLNWNFGLNAFDATNANIVVTPVDGPAQGGGRADAVATRGQTYRFAAIFPPKLIASTPSSGALNVDPNGNITLNFDVPVYSVDKKVYLWKTSGAGAPGTLIDSLNLIGPIVTPVYTGAPPANIPIDTAHVSNDLTFGPLPGLAYDSLYYITINAVTDDGSAPPVLFTGILDKPGNKFAGVSSPGTLYFKISSNIAPRLLTGPVPTVPVITKITNKSLTGAVIEATFDRRGTAFFVLTNSGAPAPTRAQILGSGKTRGGIVGAAYASALMRDSIAINQIAPATQYGLINYPLVNGNNYDVWMFAINEDQPANIATSGPYGSPPTAPSGATPGQYNVVLDGTGSPTFTFTATPQSGLVQATTVSVCTGSYQPMNTPIRFVEQNVNDFKGSGDGVQSFNLLLPTGFVFDVTRPGSVTLSNSPDFVAGSGKSTFLSNSVVTIEWKNQNTVPTSTSIDNITVSGLYVLAPSSASGPIRKLGGLSTIADLSTVATLQTNNVNPPNFINSAVGDVTFMPDSIAKPGHPTFEVQLIPSLATGDFGPSTFSGSGVNGDVLFLKSVTLSQPFLITMSHTDNNGCRSEVSNQYVVYDHKTGLGIRTQYCITEKFFPIQPPAPGSYPTKYTVRYDAFPGFYLRNVVTTDVIGLQPEFLNSTTPSAIPGYLAPSTAAKTLPLVLTSSGVDPANNPVPGREYYNWNFYVTHIDSTDWAQFSRYNLQTPRTNPYYTGGTLGSAEFKGFYQSIANAPLDSIPLTQTTEFFAPPLLYIEVSNNYTTIDTSDPINPPAPSNNPVTLGNPGTYLYCREGGTITLNGFPAAAGGSSVGTFTLFNHQTGLQITLTKPQGFEDFTNGSATIDPDNPAVLAALGDTTLATGYQDLRVVYTYKANNSPCQSTTYVVIRIVPNPVPGFTASTTCEDIPITFTSNSTISGGNQYPIARYFWDFDDPNASDNDSTTTVGSVSHTYSSFGSSDVSLGLESSVGCRSVANRVNTITIGGTPVVNLVFNGVSQSDTFNFTPTGSSVSSNDTFASFTWNFGDATAPAVTTSVTATQTHNYAAAGKYVYDLTILSGIGCTNSLSISSPVNDSRTLIVLPNRSATPSTAYEEDFEGNTGGGWVPWYASNANFPLDFTAATPPPVPSWVHPGAGSSINRTVIKNVTNAFVDTETKFWSTNSTNNPSGFYNGFERSALYSPAFDLSALKAPMISFDAISQLALSDGVIVEYSQDNKNITDPTKVWTVLGTNINEGVDWFADKGISAKPGAQTGNDFGWTGATNTNWISPKHTVDTLSVTGGGVLTNIVFRFALASNKSAPDTEGFGVDNVRIGERTRTILLESFMNTGNANPAEAAENAFVSGFPGSVVGTKVVKINYHVNFPKDDPFNLDNPTDPSSRASFYSVSSTPESRLDGSDDPDGTALSNWGIESYGKRSLQLAQADLSVIPTSQPGKIVIDVDVIAKLDIPANTVLHIAIVEDSVAKNSLSTVQQSLVLSGENGFARILKKMLPSASGTKFGTPLLKGASRSFGPFEYIRGNLYANADDLTIIAFLQREDGNREIYQVTDTTGFADPSLVTGLEPIASELVLAYPNPAHHELTVQLPGALSKPAALNLIDQTGRVALRATMQEGTDRKTLNVSDLSGGIYILTVDMGQGVLTRKKVMIVHQD